MKPLSIFANFLLFNCYTDNFTEAKSNYIITKENIEIPSQNPPLNENIADG